MLCKHCGPYGELSGPNCGQFQKFLSNSPGVGMAEKEADGHTSFMVNTSECLLCFVDYNKIPFISEKMKERNEEEWKALKMVDCVSFMEFPSVPVYH